MERWFRDHDIFFTRKIRIGYSAVGLRGLYATENIADGETIAVIPSHMILQSPYESLSQMVNKNINDARFQQLILSHLSKITIMHDEKVILLAFLLLEKLGEDSETWRSYKLHFLSDTIKNKYYISTLEVRSILMGRCPEAVINDTAEAVEMSQEYYSEVSGRLLETIAKVMIPHGDISKESIRWAMSIVASRAIGNSQSQQILPFFDMINHRQQGNCSLLVRWDEYIARRPDAPRGLRNQYVAARNRAILQLDPCLRLLPADAEGPRGPASTPALEAGDKVCLRGQPSARGVVVAACPGPGPAAARVRVRGVERDLPMSDITVLWTRRPATESPPLRSVLAVDGRPMGDADSCAVVVADGGGAGVPAGSEVFYQYHDEAAAGQQGMLLGYGFCP